MFRRVGACACVSVCVVVLRRRITFCTTYAPRPPPMQKSLTPTQTDKCVRQKKTRNTNKKRIICTRSFRTKPSRCEAHRSRFDVIASTSKYNVYVYSQFAPMAFIRFRPLSTSRLPPPPLSLPHSLVFVCLFACVFICRKLCTISGC